MQTADIEALRTTLRRLRSELFDVRWALIQRKYNPNQPRAPAGTSEGGRWTADGAAGALNDGVFRSTDSAPTLDEAATRSGPPYRVDLVAEEASGTSHAIREHVKKTDAELIAAIRAKDINTRVASALTADPQGSFDSVGSANHFANIVLDMNANEVANIISGGEGNRNVLITARIGSVTGKEAYRRDGDPTFTIRIQPTFGAGIVIRRANNARGFIVRTAFPMNAKPDRM